MARLDQLGIPRCPEALTPDLESVVEQFALLWQASPQRPRVTQHCAEQWTSLLDAWIAADDLPLLIRSPTGRRRGQ